MSKDVNKIGELIVLLTNALDGDLIDILYNDCFLNEQQVDEYVQAIKNMNCLNNLTLLQVVDKYMKK